MTQSTLFTGKKSAPAGAVECLGLRFDSDEARRDYFREQLREKLRDPEFRRTPGFPIGSDEELRHTRQACAGAIGGGAEQYRV